MTLPELLARRKELLDAYQRAETREERDRVTGELWRLDEEIGPLARQASIQARRASSVKRPLGRDHRRAAAGDRD